MKVVTLDRRHKASNDGFTHALRFDSYSDSHDYLSILERMFGTVPYSRFGGWRAPTYFTEFGSRDTKTGYKVYWIYFRKEADLTMTLLAKGN